MSLSNTPCDANSEVTGSSLRQSLIIQKRAATLGFDWPNVSMIFEKLQEEIQELQHEIIRATGHDRLQDELGDLIFCCVNIARHLNVDPDIALQKANQKFYKRFQKIEHLLEQQTETLSLDALLKLWEVAKSQVG